MAKVSRNQLKGIVKECLMEILAEGLLHESPAAPKRRQLNKRPKRSAALVNEAKPQEDRFSAAVESTVSGLTNDPIMSSIFRDTAMTTLQDQMGGETGQQVSGGSNLVNEGHGQGAELEDLFGEATDRWASLAFTEKKTMP